MRETSIIKGSGQTGGKRNMGAVSRLKRGVVRSTGRSMMPKDTERSSPVRMNERLLNLAT